MPAGNLVTGIWHTQTVHSYVGQCQEMMPTADHTHTVQNRHRVLPVWPPLYLWSRTPRSANKHSHLILLSQCTESHHRWYQPLYRSTRTYSRTGLQVILVQKLLRWPAPNSTTSASTAASAVFADSSLSHQTLAAPFNTGQYDQEGRNMKSWTQDQHACQWPLPQCDMKNYNGEVKLRNKNGPLYSLSLSLSLPPSLFLSHYPTLSLSLSLSLLSPEQFPGQTLESPKQDRNQRPGYELELTWDRRELGDLQHILYTRHMDSIDIGTDTKTSTKPAIINI